MHNNTTRQLTLALRESVTLEALRGLELISRDDTTFSVMGLELELIKQTVSAKCHPLDNCAVIPYLHYSLLLERIRLLNAVTSQTAIRAGQSLYLKLHTHCVSNIS